jgi:DnaD/phage-associated family protein
MTGFAGFPSGKLSFAHLPEQFFAELLPLVDDLYELKVILHCLWLIPQKRDEMRHTSFSELVADDVLMQGLAGDRLSPEEQLREALERAVARGALLQVTVRRPGHSDVGWYFLNSEQGRAAVGRIERGEWAPEGEGEEVHLQARRPNIFNLYENNFGLIQGPILADELRDAERTFPAEWIEDAFRIAVANNARRWSYVRSILQRWAREGRGRQEPQDSRAARREYIKGEYADQIKH